MAAATAATDIEVAGLTEGEVIVVVVGVEDEAVDFVVIDRGFDGMALVVVVET